MTSPRSARELELERRVAELEDQVRHMSDLSELLALVEAERDAMLRVVEAGLRLPWWRFDYRRACNDVWEASEMAWRRVSSGIRDR